MRQGDTKTRRWIATTCMFAGASVAFVPGCTEPEGELVAFDCAGHDFRWRLRPVDLADLSEVKLRVGYTAYEGTRVQSQGRTLQVIVEYGERVTIGGRQGLSRPLREDDTT